MLQNKNMNKNNSYYLIRTINFTGIETISIYKKLTLGQIRIVEMIYNEFNLQFLLTKYDF